MPVAFSLYKEEDATRDAPVPAMRRFPIGMAAYLKLAQFSYEFH